MEQNPASHQDMTDEQPQVRRNDDDRCYELLLDGRRIGRIDLREHELQDGRVVARLPHTEVDPQFGGRGFGTRLVRLTLDDLRHRGQLVDPACPFIRTWIEHHPDYQDLVA